MTATMPEETYSIETDSRSRAVLPGHPSERFIMQSHDDGSMLLVPALLISRAQYEYDTSPALQAMLTEAANGETVIRPRRQRRAGPSAAAS